MRRLGLATIGTVLWIATTSAHHSAAAKYDADHPVTITGTIASFSWRNPHSFLYIDVQKGRHSGQRYVVEMSSAGVLGSTGWTAATLKPGEVVTLSEIGRAHV